MKSFVLKCVAVLLITLLVANPVTATSLNPSVWRAVRVYPTSVHSFFQSQALAIAADWESTPDILESDRNTVLVRRLAPRIRARAAALTSAVPWSMVAWSVVVLSILALVKPELAWSGVAVAVAVAPYTEKFKEDSNYYRFQSKLAYIWKESLQVDPRGVFMQKRLGQTQFMPPPQILSMQLSSQILFEIIQGDADHLYDAEHVLEMIFKTALEYRPYQKRIRVIPQEYSGKVTADTGDIETFNFPDPKVLKLILIRLQTGELQLTPLPVRDTVAVREKHESMLSIRDKVMHVLQNADWNHAEEIDQEVRQNLFELPPPGPARRAYLREHLIRIAENSSQFFDVRRIDAVLNSMDLAALPAKGRWVLIVDPDTWDPVTQKAQPLGVLPREVAERVQAVQYSLNAFILMQDNEDPAKAEYLFLDRAEHKQYGDPKTYGGFSIGGGKTFVPGVDMFEVMKRRMAEQLRLPANYVWQGEWEEIKSVEPQVYGLKRVSEESLRHVKDLLMPPLGFEPVRDVQLRSTWIYHPTDEEKRMIREQMAAIDAEKKAYSDSAAYEKASANMYRSQNTHRYDARKIFVLPWRAVRIMINFMKNPRYMEEGRMVKPEQEAYILNEEFAKGRRETSRVPPNLDLLRRLLDERIFPVHIRLNMGRQISEEYYEEQLEDWRNRGDIVDVVDLREHLTWTQIGLLALPVVAHVASAVHMLTGLIIHELGHLAMFAVLYPVSKILAARSGRHAPAVSEIGASLSNGIGLNLPSLGHPVLDDLVMAGGVLATAGAAVIFAFIPGLHAVALANLLTTGIGLLPLRHSDMQKILKLNPSILRVSTAA